MGYQKHVSLYARVCVIAYVCMRKTQTEIRATKIVHSQLYRKLKTSRQPSLENRTRGRQVIYSYSVYYLLMYSYNYMYSALPARNLLMLRDLPSRLEFQSSSALL